MYKLTTVSSLDKVFATGAPKIVEHGGTMLKNERYNFQVAIYSDYERTSPRNTVTVEGIDASAVTVREVVEIPAGLASYPDSDDYVIKPGIGTGLYPDLLRPIENGNVMIRPESYTTLWITIHSPEGLTPGNYDVKVTVKNEWENKEFSADYALEVLPAELPENDLIYTNWFHYDCLSDFYNEPVFSDRFFEIMRDYVEKAVRNGMNMLLMPAFTPPLDTPEGTYRKTAQLVKVTREKDEYSFDFSLMKRFLDVCRQAGMEYFEHSHLFTQWGAKAAPKIMATVNGKEKRLFGWDTDASGKEYSKFLHAYLPAVRAFLREEKLEKKVLFHISDEPSEGNADSYARAVATVGDLLDGCMCGDALSEYLFYEKGFVKTPIVVTPRVDDFAGRCDNLWAYYTGGQLQEGLSNRIMVVPPERNRMLGIQLYAYRIKGFLHWAYNFYYDVLSHGLFDPKCNPCGYNNHAGTTYFVYPGQDGTALQSARQKVFFEGINDMRALEALEKRSGRAACDALIEKHFGRVTFHTCPASPEALLAFREELNRLAAQEEE